MSTKMPVPNGKILARHFTNVDHCFRGPNLTKRSKGTEGEKIDYAPAGTICKAHNLYQSEPDEDGCRSWVKDIPADLVAPAENSESNQYALVVRHVKCYDGRRNLEVHSILVQSDLLKNFLGEVFEGYPGLTMKLDRVEFKRPFKPFIHRWEQLVKARDAVTDPETKSHVDLLYEVLNEELGSILSRKKDLVKNGVITADLLYAIFEPGDTIFSIVEGRPRAFIFNNGSTDQCGVFNIGCKYVDYDGDFGFTSESFAIPPYEGTLPITSLPVFPLAHHKNKSAIEEVLIARGKLWESYKGYHYKHYEGVAKGYFLGRVVKFHIKGRIVIDTESYNTFNENESISVSGSYKELDDKKRLLATSALRGYALKDKKWLEFELDGLSEIVWDDRAFNSLVLPHAERDMKKLILAFARSQSKRSDSFDDVIQGKGRGVIMLLRGPPGVGKTLTAESVAEVMKVPLYVLSAGDLGTSASRVEDSLKDILNMVPRWGAVLLIDEADVFMEARDSTDLERNELVSIFLRLLEYYEVCITTHVFNEPD